jgi:hypothetical protein
MSARSSPCSDVCREIPMCLPPLKRVNAWKYAYTPFSGKSSITIGAVENTRLASPAPCAATTTSADAKSFIWSSNSKLLRTTVWKPQPSSARAISSSLTMRLLVLSLREMNNLRVLGCPSRSRAARIWDFNQVSLSGMGGDTQSRMTRDCCNFRPCVIRRDIDAELSAHPDQLKGPKLPGVRRKQQLSDRRENAAPRRKSSTRNGGR